ncbi:hypothetical protein K8B83_18780 [Shewanella inventionis]|uniref:hypothetical protein n=1 Tax=Shewanella inventionis TaxID=1738770 RepID=UPI001CBF55EE|nr:hypothetical protein [Shewanella inventionis]UAL42837.1 hypothetical protein K8B83_18780 [Shewanella inventionis]
MKKITSIAILVFLGSPITLEAAEIKLNIPSDPKASYTVLEKSRSGDEAIIVTKRVGSSGTSFSKRLYNCSNETVKYIGSGETIDSMNASKPDAKMAPIFEKSIAYYVGKEACKK